MSKTPRRNWIPTIIVTVACLSLFVALVIDARRNNTFQKDQDPQYVTEFEEFQQEMDSTGSFSYSFPSNWEIKPYTWENCCEGDKTEPDWTQKSKPITLHPKENNNVEVNISVVPYGGNYTSFEGLKASVKEDYFATVQQEGMSNGGKESLFVVVNYLGPPDAKVESFTDHRYYYDTGSDYLYIEFREKYHHDWYPENNIDNSAFTQDFEYIANSVNFVR